MDSGERTTGTGDEQYDLISVLYHALHGAENCGRYAADAEASGDEGLAAFFREAQAAQAEVAERAKGMLGIGAPSGAPLAGGPAPGLDVGPETISGGAETPVPEEPIPEEPVTEVPADVPADVAEPTVVRVPPEDLGATIRALEGGPEELPVEEALDEIDGWRLYLEGTGDRELLPVAEDLGRLGELLRSGGAHPAEIGEVLGTLGERVKALAATDVGAPVAGELRVLGGWLNTAARELSG